MNVTLILRLIFIFSLLAVISIGCITYLLFSGSDYALIVSFDAERGITTGSVYDLMRVIILVGIFQFINIAIFRIVYRRNHTLAYFLPALNAFLTLLLFMYFFVIIALN